MSLNNTRCSRFNFNLFIANGFDGWMSSNFVNNLWPKYEDGYSWFRVFGVFFPTVTGVLSGINMSGDLRAPSTDIPNGTLAAFGTSLVYPLGLHILLYSFPMPFLM